MIPNGIDKKASAPAEIADVDRALQHAVEAAQRHVVQADDRHAVEVLETRPQRDELQQVGDDVDVDAGAVGGFDERQHLDVLVERQRDVEMVHVLAPDHVVGLRRACREGGCRGSRCGPRCGRRGSRRS